jgi:hypothetical protein
MEAKHLLGVSNILKELKPPPVPKVEFYLCTNDFESYDVVHRDVSVKQYRFSVKSKLLPSSTPVDVARELLEKLEQDFIDGLSE